jgi:hypothetical protein
MPRYSVIIPVEFEYTIEGEDERDAEEKAAKIFDKEFTKLNSMKATSIEYDIFDIFSDEVE